MGMGTVGSIIGNELGKGDRNRADGLRNQALAEFANLSVPDIEKMKLALEQYGSAGNLTPEMVQLISQGDTALEGISIDPRLRASQMSALDQISGIASSGMSEGDMAAFEMARRNAASEAQAKQGQILQNMAQRGQSGSGAELAASLANAQGSADRLQQAQLEEAKQRQAARMAALQQQANMSSGLRSADYSEQSNLASARDAIARFNAANAQQVAQANTGAKNSAQQMNLQNDQSIRNQNTGLSNQQQQYNKQLQQQDYENKMRRASAMSGQYTQAAGDADARAGRTQGLYSGIGAGIQQGINSMAGGMAGGGMGGFATPSFSLEDDTPTAGGGGQTGQKRNNGGFV